MAEIYTPPKNSCGKSIFVCHILHKQFRFLIAIVSLDSFKMCFHFLKGSSIFKMYFHFQNLLLSFFKSALIFKMCFHFQNLLSFSNWFQLNKDLICLHLNICWRIFYFHRFLWFMPSLGARSLWLMTLYIGIRNDIQSSIRVSIFPHTMRTNLPKPLDQLSFSKFY